MFNGCAGFGYGGFGGGPFMMIIPTIITGIIIYAIFKLLSQQKYSQARENSEALNILMERYALGEISEEEYMNKKKLLRR
jgi:putative membrane protein